jgi:hypothetical protein
MRPALRETFFLLAALAALTFGASCSRRCSLEPVRCSKLSEKGAPTVVASEREQRPAAVSEGRIYLDLSQSMRGFIADSGGAMSFTLLQRGLDGLLEEAFATAGVPSPALLGFGSELRRGLPPLSTFVVSSGAVSPRSRYAEVRTDLGAALRDARKAPQALSVVVTDGAQDLRSQGGKGIGQGFVRTALVRLVREEMIERGFGVWVVGVMSEFGDCYYNVRPDRHGRVGQCIKVRRRPAYFWVFSRDHEKGRSLVRYLVRELRLESGGEEGKGPGVEAIEIWPGTVPAARFEPASGEDLARIATLARIDRTRLAAVLGWRAEEQFPGATAACIRLPWAAGSTVQLPAVLRFDAADPAPAELAAPAALWNVTVEPPQELPSFKVREVEEAAGGRRLLIELAYDEATALGAEGSVEVPVVLRPDFRAGLRKSWVGRWSTRDDASTEAIEGKTLYLSDVVEGLLGAQLPAPRTVACLHLEMVRN